MSNWLNLLGYELVWFVAVYGAGRGLAWPALVATLLFAAWQLALSAQRGLEVRLIVAGIALGMLVDGALAGTGVLHYAAPSPALPAGGAPLWILALWVAFALTLNHSLRWLAARPLLSGLFGALGGPLAYAGAGRLAGAVSFAPPAWHATLWLAGGWGAALLVLSWLTGYRRRATHDAQAVLERSPI
jgi:hypothetical protein